MTEKIPSFIGTDAKACQVTIADKFPQAVVVLTPVGQPVHLKVSTNRLVEISVDEQGKVVDIDCETCISCF